MADQRTAETFIADLELAVSNIEDIKARLLAEIREHGEEFTPEQEAKWEGAFKMAMGVLSDELYPMLRAWKEGDVSSRKSELILEGKATPDTPTQIRVVVGEESA